MTYAINIWPKDTDTLDFFSFSYYIKLEILTVGFKVVPAIIVLFLIT